MTHAPDAPDADRPLVTFFVMAWRQEGQIREAIEGAFAQTYSPLEIILSDDASPDATFAVMEEMAAAYDGPHHVVLNRNPTNLGICAHLDRVMELASGRIVVQNAGDDVSRPGRTAALVAAWAASGPPGARAALLHSPATIIDAEGREIGRKNPSPELRRDPSPLGLVRRHVYVLGAASAWDRAVWDRFGPLGAGLGVEDTVIPARAAALGGIAEAPEPLVAWRAGGLSWADRRDLRARDYLYGSRRQVLRWRLQSLEALARDLPRVDFAGRAACLEEIARLREMVGYDLALGERSAAGLLLGLPRAAALTLRLRSRVFLVQHLKYLFAPIYARWLNARCPPGTLRW